MYQRKHLIQTGCAVLSHRFAFYRIFLQMGPWILCYHKVNSIFVKLNPKMRMYASKSRDWFQSSVNWFLIHYVAAFFVSINALHTSKHGNNSFGNINKRTVSQLIMPIDTTKLKCIIMSINIRVPTKITCSQVFGEIIANQVLKFTSLLSSYSFQKLLNFQ